MGRTSNITTEMALDIKKALWEGVPQQELADKYKLSQGSISRIRNGSMQMDVKWPDGSDGPIPEYRRLQLMKSRQRDTRAAKVQSIYKTSHTADLEREGWEILREVTRIRQQQTMLDVARTLVEEKGWSGDWTQGMDGITPPPELNGHTAPPPQKDEPQPRLEWEYVLNEASSLPIVKEADEKDDAALKDAICITFAQQPKGNWHLSAVVDCIHRIAASNIVAV